MFIILSFRTLILIFSGNVVTITDLRPNSLGIDFHQCLDVEEINLVSFSPEMQIILQSRFWDLNM